MKKILLVLCLMIGGYASANTIETKENAATNETAVTEVESSEYKYVREITCLVIPVIYGDTYKATFELYRGIDTRYEYYLYSNGVYHYIYKNNDNSYKGVNVSGYKYYISSNSYRAFFNM